MALSTLAILHSGNNQNGYARLFGLARDERYRVVRSDSLMSYGLHRNIGSATIFSSNTADANVILFSPDGLRSGFYGNWLQLTNRKGSGNELEVDSMYLSGVGKETTDLLFVSTSKGPEYRFSFRDMFLDKWINIVDSLGDSLKGGHKVKRDGDPFLSWVMWPQNTSYLDPNRRYLVIHQNLKIDVNNWPWDYDASITYHIYLYLDNNGSIRGHIARWAYWVDQGTLGGVIKDQLGLATRSGMETLNEELTKQFALFSGFKFNDLYYLPGNQIDRPPTGIMFGNGVHDVTIVVES